MTDALHTDPAPDFRHNIVAGHASRLIDNEESEWFQGCLPLLASAEGRRIRRPYNNYAGMSTFAASFNSGITCASISSNVPLTVAPDACKCPPPPRLIATRDTS